MRKTLLTAASLATVAGLAAAGWSSLGRAQQPAPTPVTQGTQGIKRIPLQKVEVPGTSHETVTAIAEIAPNVQIGRHTHFGPETGYVLEGEATLIIDGQPPKEIKSGESYQIPGGAVHDAKAGPKGAKVLAVYTVEKGKPLATPAP